jgi:membrane protein DedA with SNARE-associated domain
MDAVWQVGRAVILSGSILYCETYQGLALGAKPFLIPCSLMTRGEEWPCFYELQEWRDCGKPNCHVRRTFFFFFGIPIPLCVYMPLFSVYTDKDNNISIFLYILLSVNGKWLASQSNFWITHPIVRVCTTVFNLYSVTIRQGKMAQSMFYLCTTNVLHCLCYVEGNGPTTQCCVCVDRK